MRLRELVDLLDEAAQAVSDLHDGRLREEELQRKVRAALEEQDRITRRNGALAVELEQANAQRMAANNEAVMWKEKYESMRTEFLTVSGENTTLHAKLEAFRAEKKRLEERIEGLQRTAPPVNSANFVAKALFEEVQRDADHWKKLHDAMQSRCQQAEASLTLSRQAAFDFEQSLKAARAKLSKIEAAIHS